MVVCAECQTLVDLLQHCALEPTETMRRLFNRQMDYTWDDIRDFLALHYYVNTRLDTPFWRHCREDTDVSTLAELLEFYRENGPTGFARYTLNTPENNFGIEGYLVMLVGNSVPYNTRHKATVGEIQTWNAHRGQFITQALSGLDVKEALGYVRHPGWQWNAEIAASNPGIKGSPNVPLGTPIVQATSVPTR
jgi:tryptophan 7-halogenase